MIVSCKKGDDVTIVIGTGDMLVKPVFTRKLFESFYLKQTYDGLKPTLIDVTDIETNVDREITANLLEFAKRALMLKMVHNNIVERKKSE